MNIKHAKPKPGGSRIPLAEEGSLRAKGVSRFLNRELSWLAFNGRVLEEAGNKRHPLLERIKFLGISASNLDEFYMVRVAGLKAQVRAGMVQLSPDGKTPLEQIESIESASGKLRNRQAEVWGNLRLELKNAGVNVMLATNATGAAAAAPGSAATACTSGSVTPWSGDWMEGEGH